MSEQKYLSLKEIGRDPAVRTKINYNDHYWQHVLIPQFLREVPGIVVRKGKKNERLYEPSVIPQFVKWLKLREIAKNPPVIFHSLNRMMERVIPVKNNKGLSHELVELSKIETLDLSVGKTREKFTDLIRRIKKDQRSTLLLSIIVEVESEEKSANDFMTELKNL